MSPSVVDCASNLLCSEEVELLALDDTDDSAFFNYVGGVGDGGGGCAASTCAGGGEDESISALVEKEVCHMPRDDYLQRFQDKTLDAGARKDAVSWLLKVHAHYNFGPLTAALSVNYLDRFLSRHPLPAAEKTWMFQLVSVACLSLAAKMEETEVPLLLDLQVQGAKFIFEPRTIQRMELLVLGTLEWRMSSVTPFSYIDLFIRKLAVKDHLQHVLTARIKDLILNILQDTRFLAYRPSAVAAAAATYAVEELLPARFSDCKQAFLSTLPISKGTAERCFHLMEECFTGPFHSNMMKSKRKAFCGASIPQSPIGVLDASFGCDSESTVRSLESSPSVYHLVSSLAVKKQRRDDELELCGGATIPLLPNKTQPL